MSVPSICYAFNAALYLGIGIYACKAGLPLLIVPCVFVSCGCCALAWVLKDLRYSGGRA